MMSKVYTDLMSSPSFKLTLDKGVVSNFFELSDLRFSVLTVFVIH